MSAINFCDVGHHAYSSSEIGSQNITATTVFRHPNGQLDSRSERFDVCKAHALRTPNSEEYISVTNTDESPAKVVNAIAAEESTIIDGDGDVWEQTGATDENGTKLYACGGMEPRTKKAIERGYGLK